MLERLFFKDADLTDLLAKAIAIVRSEIGPVAAFRDAVFVSKLPKTRSGKTPRNTLQAISNQTTYKVSCLFSTLENRSLNCRKYFYFGR